MTQLINYLNHAPTGRVYDDYDLATLQEVYDRSRAELGIGDTDHRRERLAILLFKVVERSGIDAHLLGRVVAAFRA